MIKKFDFKDKKRLSLKAKIIIFLAVLLGIVIGLDYFFDNYTFVSPIKKLEFQWVIQRRSKTSFIIPKNAQNLTKKAGKNHLAMGVKAQEKQVVKSEPSITPYPKYMTNQAFQLRNVILEYVKDKLTGNELIAFDNILKKESGYNPEIINEIGAGGLCQAYPYQKMPCQLSQNDWKCQVDWCLKYIENRYKNSIEAWRFHEKNNWF